MWYLTIHYYDGTVETKEFRLFVDIAEYLLSSFQGPRFIHITITAPVK